MTNPIAKRIFHTAVKTIGTQRFYRAVSNIRMGELASQLSVQFENKVTAGPFEGMILPVESSWGDGDFVQKIIGSYEANLREAILRAVARKPATVINVGCAEGYYAIGFARLLPDATVYAFDIDTNAQAICRAVAEENGVNDHVVVEGICTSDRLTEIIESSTSTLIVMDCEGAELDLLDPRKVPGLARCDIVVEAHDFIVPDITKILEDRFRASHDIERISQGGRNPNEIEELADYSEADRWLMVDEKRPTVMTWLACWARAA